MSMEASAFRRGMVVAGLLAWLSPRQARAEDSVAYKYEDYRESGGRIAVQAQYGSVEKDLGADTKLRLQGVIDAIAGATPNGEPPTTPNGQVPLSNLTERRKAWNADLSHQFSRVNVSVGYANSRESDYVSNGWSLNTLTDFHQKNTTMLLGVAGTDDTVAIPFLRTEDKKRGYDLIAGVTQLLDPRTSVTANVGFGHVDGYLGDPYRVVQQRTEVLPGIFLPLDYPENRPRDRDKWTLYLQANHSFADVGGAVEASYRFYHDTFGTDSHTVEVAWYQNLGSHFILRPMVRLYDQSAAEFYRVNLNNAGFTPSQRAAPAGPFFSADYRLSALRSYDYGVKAIWTITPQWQIDGSVERYEMRGRDGVTSPSAYPTATIVAGGIKFSW